MESENNSYEQMCQRKEKIENELKEFGKVLEQEGNVGMYGNLVDSEGYPRADIDLYKVRLSRQKINCLQTDYNELLNKIEAEFGRIFQKYKINENQIMLTSNEKKFTNNVLKAFIKIEHVDINSPAFEAGLQRNDFITQFGPCTYTNTNKDLNDIIDVVKNSLNKIILVKISRKEIQDGNLNQDSSNVEQKILKLTPKIWNGYGYLGCKLCYIE